MPGSASRVVWKARAQVDRDDRVPLRDGKVLDRRDVLDAGVVDEDVDAAELARRVGHHGLDLGRLAHVGAVVAGLHAERGDLRLRPVDIAEAVEHDVRALARQALAMPRPMPLVEPVTRAVLPLSMTFLRVELDVRLSSTQRYGSIPMTATHDSNHVTCLDAPRPAPHGVLGVGRRAQPARAGVRARPVAARAATSTRWRAPSRERVPRRLPRRGRPRPSPTGSPIRRAT